MSPEPIQFGSENTRVDAPDRQPSVRDLAERHEDIHIRNYDFQRGYDLAISVRDRSDTIVFEDEFYFQPGQTRSLDEAFRPGEYRVEVEIDGRRRDGITCEIGDGPADGIFVELGNGRVSVTEGTYV